MNNEQWTIIDTMNNEQWTNERWTMNNEQRTMNNEQWTMKNEQWKMNNEHSLCIRRSQLITSKMLITRNDLQRTSVYKEIPAVTFLYAQLSCISGENLWTRNWCEKNANYSCVRRRTPGADNILIPLIRTETVRKLGRGLHRVWRVWRLLCENNISLAGQK